MSGYSSRRGSAGESRAMIALAGVLLVFNLIIFPSATARIGGASAAKPLDLRAAYTPADAYTALAQYGTAGRDAYAVTELTLDVIYPVTYAFFFWLLLRVIVRQLGLLEPLSRWLTTLPFVVLAADLLENMFVLLLLARFPSHADRLALAASAIGTIKWLLFGVMVLVSIVGGIASARSVVRRARGVVRRARSA